MAQGTDRRRSGSDTEMASASRRIRSTGRRAAPASAHPKAVDSAKAAAPPINSCTASRVESLVAIVERASDHHEGSVRARHGQHTNGQDHARSPRFGERIPVNGVQRAGCQERVGCERGGEGNDLAGSVDDLRERVIGFDDRAARRQGFASIGGRRHELRLGEQALIDR